MKIDSTTVTLVLLVEEEGSITRAADRMQLAVAAASKRITDLETQLATRLFKRQAHGVRLTEAGEKLLAHIKQIDNLTQRLRSDARALSQGRGGRILIGAPKAAAIQFLAADLARIHHTDPEIQLQVVEENSRIVQQLLRDRVIDVGIFEKTSGFMELPQWNYRSDELHLIYHRRHFSLQDGPLDIDDLLPLPIISLGRGSAILASLTRAYESRGRVFQSRFTVSGFDTMLALVQEGVGVGLMPPGVFERFRTGEDMVSAALEGEWHRRSYVLSFIEGHAQQQTLHHVVNSLLRRSAFLEEAPPY